MTESPPKRASACARAGCAGDRDRGGEAEALEKAKQPPAELRLAAEQMGRAGQVKPDHVGSGDTRGRRPASDRMEGEPVEQGAILVRLRVVYVEIGHERPRVRRRHAATQPQLQGNRTYGRDDIALAYPLDHDGRPRPYRSHRQRGGRHIARCAFIGGHGLERIVGGFAAPPHLAHCRALMLRQRINLGLAWLSAARGSLRPLRRAMIGERPARARPPAAAARNRACAGIVIDRRRKSRL